MTRVENEVIQTGFPNLKCLVVPTKLNEKMLGIQIVKMSDLMTAKSADTEKILGDERIAVQENVPICDVICVVQILMADHS